MNPQILIDARLIMEKPTGIGQYIAALIPHLVQQAPDIQFHILQRPHPFPGYHLDQWQAPNLTIHLSQEPQMTLRQHWTLPRLARQLKANLLHYPHFDAPVHLSPVPVVSTMYDTKYISQPDFFTRLSWFKIQYMRWCYQHTTHKAKAIFCISHSTAQDVQKFFGPVSVPLPVTYLAADPAFKPSSPAAVEALKAKYNLTRPFILTVGEHRPHKNHAFLVKAYAQSSSRHTHDLVIVGTPHQDYQLPQQLVAQLNLNHQVHWLTKIPFDELIVFYSAAQLFAFPSLYEGFGLPILEAMACGLPVIASNTTATSEITGAAGWQLDPQNVPAWAAAFDELLTNLTLWQEYHTKGLAHSATFSWATCASQTLKIYRQFL